MNDNNKTENMIDFKAVCANFEYEGEFAKAEPYGNGHINETYAVYFSKKNGSPVRYILQKINTYVFKKPDELMSNIEKVTRHLKTVIEKEGGDIGRETLNIIPTTEGKSYFADSDGNYWRSYIFIEDAKTYDIVENDAHFYNAAKAFGKFQNKLSEFTADELFETIVNFHNTMSRYEDFNNAVDEDKSGRAQYVKEEIAFFKERQKYAGKIVSLMEKGDIPLRVTHNDTKFNNVMIDDKTGEGICVLDLDTVMPGSALYDFGDSIRFGASSALEDETDLNKVWMKLELFEAFTKGFLEETKDILTEAEVKNLAFSAILMTLECGIRFLGDYLNGDIYFKIHRENHNLDRARTQIKLVQDMESKLDKMNKVVNKYL